MFFKTKRLKHTSLSILQVFQIIAVQFLDQINGHTIIK